MSEEPESRKEFFHNTTNITEWMQEKIEELLKRKGYRILMIKIESEIMARMSKLTIINSVDIKFVNEKNELFTLDKYSSMGKDLCTDEKVSWLIGAIKEFEMEALIKFGSDALMTKRTTTATIKPEAVFSADIKNPRLLKKDDLKIDFCFTATEDEIVSFFTKPDLQSVWSRGETIGNTLKFENVEIKNIQVKKMGVNEYKMTMMYKWNDWNEYSDVTIDLLGIYDYTQVTILHTGIPIKLLETVRNHWMTRVFGFMSQIFGRAIKNGY